MNPYTKNVLWSGIRAGFKIKVYQNMLKLLSASIRKKQWKNLTRKGFIYISIPFSLHLRDALEIKEWPPFIHFFDFKLFLPKQVGLLWFLWTAGIAKDLEHVWKGTSVSRLGDENSTPQEKDKEGHPKAHSGDDVAEFKAEILLDVGHKSQRQYGSKVDAPVEPVEKSPRGLGSSVFNLWLHTEKDQIDHMSHMHKGKNRSTKKLAVTFQPT